MTAFLRGPHDAIKLEGVALRGAAALHAAPIGLIRTLACDAIIDAGCVGGRSVRYGSERNQNGETKRRGRSHASPRQDLPSKLIVKSLKARNLKVRQSKPDAATNASNVLSGCVHKA